MIYAGVQDAIALQNIKMYRINTTIYHIRNSSLGTVYLAKKMPNFNLQNFNTGNKSTVRCVNVVWLIYAKMQECSMHHILKRGFLLFYTFRGPMPHSSHTEYCIGTRETHFLLVRNIPNTPLSDQFISPIDGGLLQWLGYLLKGQLKIDWLSLHRLVSNGYWVS